MRVPWLGDVLQAAGLPVVPYGNPRGVGREMLAIHAVVDHDTVTTRGWTDGRVCSLLRHGRPGVPGPLAQLGLDRDGVFHWIADGRANHNGYGDFGNNTIGIEVFCAGGLRGHEEPWNAVQRDHVARANAAILTRLGLPASRARGHKETDARRKIDPWGVSMAAIRERTQAYMENPSRPIATPEVLATMPLIAFIKLASPGRRPEHTDDTIFILDRVEKTYKVVPTAEAWKTTARLYDVKEEVLSTFLRSEVEANGFRYVSNAPLARLYGRPVYAP